MSWSHEQERRRAELRAMTVGELIHVMIVNFDGDKESTGPYTQNFDYYWASEALDRRFGQAGD